MELEQDEESGGLNLNSKEMNLNLNRNFLLIFYPFRGLFSVWTPIYLCLRRF